MTIKIALTVAIICGSISWVMVIADKGERYSGRNESYALVGGGLMLITIAAIVTALIAGIWDL